ncbi:hypothetical protein [uncultured Rikenella sp.]|uniref:hypothetical protein n=1 Tax=uncultured Rikenella sp. TaxID=368003 RepID=UPI0025E6BF54|nr:hypothetical protein [uncultured Rikenella sp.]
MKKTILLLVVLLLNANAAIKAQKLEDYEKTWKDIALTYDDNWNPIVNFSIKNISNKYIENVEIIVGYSDDQFDLFARQSTIRIKTRIAPNERKLLSFRILDHNDNRPKQFGLSRIRYADGTICDK